MSAQNEMSEASTGRRPRWTEAEGRKVVTEWKESGKPLARYAREQQVPHWRLRWWAQRLGEVQGRKTPQTEGQSVDTIELIPAVVRPATVMASSSAMLVRLPEGIAVEMRSVEDVARLVTALRRVDV